MEAILTDCVRNSLRHFMHRNAIFMCQRLCAEFPSEKNLQLLATCYLQNNQSHCAYQILKGTQMAQCRYLFALACFQMDLLSEAEAALSPNESSAEVPNGAAGHYLLGIIFRYTDRRRSAIHQFNQALLLDPLLWAAYEELCILGAAEEATSVFDEGASLCIQKQYLHAGLASQILQAPSEDHDNASNRNLGTADVSTKQLHTQCNNLQDISGNYNGAASNQPLNGGPANLPFYNTPSPMASQSQLSGVAPPPVFRNAQPNGPNMKAFGADSSPRQTVNSTIPGPRRKFVDEGKLRKVSERLFSDSGQRRSMRLAGESLVNTNSSLSIVSGNGTSHSSKYIGGSKSSSVASRSLTIRKGQTWASENADEGTHHDMYDDSRSSITASSSSPYGDNRYLEQEGVTRPSSTAVLSSSKNNDGASEILGLLRLLGDGFRLSCLSRCQDALDIYIKLPPKHYNTGWVLSQVGKAYFEMVDYLEADRAFSLGRIASPYSLEGMDIYSTVLYHLKEDMKLSYLAQELVSTDRLAPQSWC